MRPSLARLLLPAVLRGLSASTRARRGSAVASWLVDLTAEALHQDPEPGCAS